MGDRLGLAGLAFAVAISLLPLDSRAATQSPIQQQPPAIEQLQKIDNPPDLFPPNHVRNGCVVDALRYIENLKKVRPELEAKLIHVNREHRDGEIEQHVMALITTPEMRDAAGKVTASSQYFIRDEFLGVMDLKVDLKNKPLTKQELSDVALDRFNAEVNERARDNHTGRYEVTRPIANTFSDKLKAAHTVADFLPDSKVFNMAGKDAMCIWHPSEDIANLEPRPAGTTYTVYIYLPGYGSQPINLAKPASDMAIAREIARIMKFKGDIHEDLTLPATTREVASVATPSK